MASGSVGIAVCAAFVSFLFCFFAIPSLSDRSLVEQQSVWHAMLSHTLIQWKLFHALLVGTLHAVIGFLWAEVTNRANCIQNKEHKQQISPSVMQLLYSLSPLTLTQTHWTMLVHDGALLVFLKMALERRKWNKREKSNEEGKNTHTKWRATTELVQIIGMGVTVIIEPHFILVVPMLAAVDGKRSPWIVTIAVGMVTIGTLVSYWPEKIASAQWLLLSEPSTRPNIGIWWYFYTNMFASFKSFFTVILYTHPVMYVVPLLARFEKQPLFALYAAVAIALAFKPYPTLYDLQRSYLYILLNSHMFSKMRNISWLLYIQLLTIITMPLMRILWLHASSGNANFLYFQTLLSFSVQCGVIIEAVAGMRHLLAEGSCSTMEADSNKTS